MDNNILFNELKKIFKAENATTEKDILELGFVQKDIDLVKQFIINRTDPIKWIKNNVTIKHPGLGSVKFNLYDFQEKIIKIFLKKHFVITLKSRQVGMSTVAQGLCLWAAMNYSNYNVIILSVNQRSANSFLDKIKFMYNSLPNNMYKLKITTDNKLSLVFENGSKIAAIPSTRQAALGESINFLIIDEAAFIRNIDDVYQGAYPTLSKAFSSASGKPYGVMMISTPNGISGLGKFYFEMYDQAVREENSFVPVRVHWSLVPEYDDAWYEDQCRNLKWDYQKIAAELELSFVSSGATFIPGPVLDTIDITMPSTSSYDKKLWIWQMPEKGESYVAGVDVSYGNRADYSTIQILNARTLEQVAEFESNTIRVKDFANVIINLSKIYHGCLFNIERNTVGKILIEEILDKTGGLGINLYRDENPGELHVDKTNFKTSIGTLVTGQSRAMILGNMYDIVINHYIEGLDNMVSTENTGYSAKEQFQKMISGNNNSFKKQGIIKSQRLLNQFLKFVKNGENKFEADHDDLIFAYAHALYCYSKSKEMLLKNYANVVSNAFSLNTNERFGAEDKLAFIKRYSDSRVWNDMTADDLKQLEDESAVNDAQNFSGSTAGILKSFYKF